MEFFWKDLENSNVHGNHKLKRVSIYENYTCNACKQEGGPGKIYRCEYCDYDFHSACATVPKICDALKFSDERCILNLSKYDRKFGDLNCECCGGKITRYFLGNLSHRRFFHPFCANIPSCFEMDGYNFKISQGRRGKCHACGKSLRTWAYKYGNRDDRHYVHVKCIDKWYVRLDKKWKVKRRKKRRKKRKICLDKKWKNKILFFLDKKWNCKWKNKKKFFKIILCSIVSIVGFII